MGTFLFLRFSVLLLTSCFTLAVAADLQNITIVAPEGTTNHGDPNLICTPTLWTDAISFFIGNYVAHAATVIAVPGESAVSLSLIVIMALLFPSSGVVRGISAFMSFAKFAKKDLQMAARAEALCMVAREPGWTPNPGDSVSDAIYRVGDNVTPDGADVPGIDPCLRIFDPPWGSPTPVPLSTRYIHGSFRLPRGYHLVYVPKDAEFSKLTSESNSISCSYSLVKILVALGQSIYAATTLFRSRGDQITQYGYAAFGLTVAQYAVMSIVNLLGNLMVPEYSALYMVETSIMAEARKREDAFFDGVVGQLTEEPDAEFGCQTDKDRWLAGPLKFESLKEQSRIKVEVDLLSKQNAELPSIETEISSRTATPVAAGLSNPSEKLSLAVITTVDPTFASVDTTVKPKPDRKALLEPIYDGRPILFIPSCPVLTRSTRTKQAKPRYTITNSGTPDPSKLKIDDNLAGEKISSLASLVLGVMITAVPFAIIGALSGFHPGSSTVAQRVWTMTWLSFGIIFGFMMRVLHSRLEMNKQLSGWRKFWSVVSWIAVCSPPAVGGFIVVGQMLKAFGTCIPIYHN